MYVLKPHITSLVKFKKKKNHTHTRTRKLIQYENNTLKKKKENNKKIHFLEVKLIN